MKSIIVTAALMLSLGIQHTLLAQQSQVDPITQQNQKQKSPAEVASNRASMMQEKLGLNNDQTTKIKNILFKHLTAKANNPDADQKALRKATNDEIMKVLTPAQQKKYLEMKEEQKKKVENKEGNTKSE